MSDTSAHLEAMFPSLPPSTLSAILAAHNNDPEAAVMAILAMDTTPPSSPPPSPPPSPKTSPFLPPGDENDDLISALYRRARVLGSLDSAKRQTYGAEEHKTEAAALALRDEALARRFAAREAKAAGGGEAHALHAALLEDPALVERLKAGLVPVLTGRIRELIIPPMEGANSSGSVVYAVDQTHVDDVRLEVDDVELAVGDHVRMVVSRMDVTLVPTGWSYTKSTRPSISSSGDVLVSLKSCSIHCHLALHPVPGGETGLITVSPTVVTISKLKLKFQGSWGNLLYSAIAGLFKRRLKAEIEASIAASIDDFVNNESVLLLRSIGLS